MRTALILLVALLLAGCHAMQPTPVAPSAVNPPAPPQTGSSLPPPAQTYTVSLNANGGGMVGTWQSTLAVSAPSGAQPPASVLLNCGNGSALQTLPSFLGLRVITCTFDTPGDYTVTASAVAANAVTTSASTTVSVLPSPPPPPLPTQSVSINAQRIGGTSTSAEWRFLLQASTADTWGGIGWDFGDGSGSASDRTVDQHVYTKAGTYTVRVTAHSSTRNADFVGTREIDVKF